MTTIQFLFPSLEIILVCRIKKKDKQNILIKQKNITRERKL